MLPDYEEAPTGLADGLPASEETERAVLGAILLDPLLIEQAESKQLRPEHFWWEKNSLLYRAMVAVREGGAEVDRRTLQFRLERDGHLDRVGGVGYLAALDLDLPDIGRFDTYVDLLLEAYAKRRLLQAAADLVKMARNGVKSSEAVADTIRALEGIQANAGSGRWQVFSEVAEPVFAMLEVGTEMDPEYIATGIPDLDRIGGGVAIGKETIIAGRPGHGKTALAQQIAENMAMKGVPVAIVSLEMSKRELVLRSIARHTGIPFDRLRSGQRRGDDWSIIHRAMQKLHNVPMWIDDEVRGGVSSILPRCSALRRKHGARVFIVDHYGLIPTDDLRRANGEREKVNAMSKALSNWAKSENVGLIALSQLARVAQNSVRPMLHHLKESGNLEADAYSVWLIWQECDEKGSMRGRAEINVAKHRNGPTGVIETIFDGPRMKFKCIDKERT